MKEAVTNVIDTLTQEDFHGAFQKLLERYNKCIAARGDYFEGDQSFLYVLSIKVPIRKKSGNLFNDPHIYIYIYIYIYVYIYEEFMQLLSERRSQTCCQLNLHKIMTLESSFGTKSSLPLTWCDQISIFRGFTSQYG